MKARTNKVWQKIFLVSYCLLAVGLVGCGQRLYLPDPEGKVEDTRAY